VAFVVGVILAAVDGGLAVGVYLLALLPGAWLCRHVLRLYPDTVEHQSFCRTALAGLVYTAAVLLAEELLGMAVYAAAAALFGGGGDPVSIIVFLALLEAFLVAAFAEEYMKLHLARRAVPFERAATPTAVLLHAVAGSAAFATLENVVYLSFRSPGGVSVASLFIRSVFCVPAHVAWGVSNASRLAIINFGSNGNHAALSLSYLFAILAPSVLLHGSWDLFLFLAGYYHDFLLLRCKRIHSSDNMDACVHQDAVAARLYAGLNTASVLCLVSGIVVPACTIYITRRRVIELRGFEAGAGNDTPYPPPAYEVAVDVGDEFDFRPPPAPQGPGLLQWQAHLQAARGGTPLAPPPPLQPQARDNNPFLVCAGLDEAGLDDDPHAPVLSL